MKKNKPLLIAHRGYSDIAPENTQLAFDAAYIFGFDGIEIDVHKTKDNELVVIHDETIDRTSDGVGRVMNLTLDELRQFNFSAKFKIKGFKKQTILTYKEFLLLYGNKFKHLNIEVKTDILKYEGIESEIIKVTKVVNPKAEIVFSSFNFDSLRIMHKIDKSLKLGFLFEDIKLIKHIVDEVKYICTYIHPWFKTMLDKTSMDIYENINLPLNVWSLDYEEKNNEWTNGSFESFKTLKTSKTLNSIISNIYYEI